MDPARSDVYKSMSAELSALQDRLDLLLEYIIFVDESDEKELIFQHELYNFVSHVADFRHDFYPFLRENVRFDIDDISPEEPC